MNRPRQTRKALNIVLDLDNTLISAIDEDEIETMGVEVVSARQKAFTWLNMEDEFKVFERPGLQKFLTWLFANFNVSVWTAASKSYALFIIEKFVIAGRPERKLDYVLFSHHCRESKRNHNYQKSLEMMSNVFPQEYTLDKTYIVDDNKEVFDAQPTMCIRVKPFDVQKNSCVKDVELDRIKRHLEAVRIKHLEKTE